MENNELQLQRYQIIERIGEGGMSNVYLAYDKVLKRECAIKILKADLSESPVALLRFKREADAASKLHHPSIVTIYDVGESKNHHFIVMEYVKGKTLKSLIQQRGAIEKEEAVFIMKQILEGIVVAHEAGVIHRDIKPQNILIKADGTVKITDFGIATTEGAIQLTQHDSVMGSVHYMAPECARGEQATNQSDLYSLGIVFYEMLTGEVPYKGEGAVQVAMKHLKDEIRPVREFNNSIEQSIENIIVKATAKNKNLRYLSAKQMLEDLKVALSAEHRNDPKTVLEIANDGETIVFDEVDAKSIKKAPKNKEKRKKQVLIGVIVVAVLIILGVLVSELVTNRPSDLIEIPTVENMEIDDAIEKLEALGFVVSSRYDRELHEEIEEDRVIGTEPEIGKEVEKGSTIRLVVSDGVYILVEDYSGWMVNEVRELFDGTRVRIRVEEDTSSSIEAGTIISQELLLPGDKVDPRVAYELKLIVSKAASFVIPDIIGTSIENARVLIEIKGGVVDLIKLDTSSLSDDEYRAISFNQVIEVNPKVGELYTQDANNTVQIKYYEDDGRILKDDLRSLVNFANTQVDTTDKTAASVEIFNNALQQAEGVLQSTTATQPEVDNARIRLEQAINGLEVETEEGQDE